MKVRPSGAGKSRCAVHAPSPGKYVEHVKMYYGNILPYAGRVTG